MAGREGSSLTDEEFLEQLKELGFSEHEFTD